MSSLEHSNISIIKYKYYTKYKAQDRTEGRWLRWKRMKNGCFQYFVFFCGGMATEIALCKCAMSLPDPGIWGRPEEYVILLSKAKVCFAHNLLPVVGICCRLFNIDNIFINIIILQGWKLPYFLFPQKFQKIWVKRH